MLGVFEEHRRLVGRGKQVARVIGDEIREIQAPGHTGLMEGGGL